MALPVLFRGPGEPESKGAKNGWRVWWGEGAREREKERGSGKKWYGERERVRA